MAIGNTWVTALGPEKSVNIETTSGGAQYVDIAALAGGGAVAVWQEYDPVGSYWESYAQMLDADGNKVGPKIYVSDIFGFSNANPQVAALADGGFAVTFEVLDGHGTGWGTLVRQYDASGSPVSWERVNNVVNYDEIKGDVAGLSNGTYVVVWDSDTSDGIYAEILDSTGASVRDDFRVSTTSFGTMHGTPHVHALSDGGFFVMWQVGLNSSGQRFDAAGNPVGGEISLAYGENQQFAVLSDGRLAVTWYQLNVHPNSYDVHVRTYAIDGTPDMSAVKVHAPDNGTQLSPGIFALSDGGFVVTWDHQNTDGSGYATMARRFGANGEAVGEEFIVNAGDGSQFVDGEPKLQVAQLANGHLMFSWVERTTDPVTLITANEIKNRVFDLAEIHTGTGSADQIAGNAADNWMAGLAGNDTLRGFDGDDILFGDAGNDLLKGGNDNDTLDGGGGRDTLGGGSGNDSLTGGNRGDALFGHDGDDTADGGSGGDRVVLGSGDDRGFGGSGNDRMFGNQGRDTLYGGQGDDRIWGGTKADRLNGGAGDDTLTGGGGSDVFIFNGGADVITDWNAEAIRFDSAVWGGASLTPAQVMAYATDVGADTVFDFLNGNTLTVQGTTDWALLETYVTVL